MKKLNTIKHLQAIAKGSSKSRPILEGIRYTENGAMSVTDSHRLLTLYGRHPFKEAATIHAFTMEPLEGQYPDLSRIIPDKSSGEGVTLEASQFKEIKNFLTGVKKDTMIKLELTGPQLILKLESGATLTLNLNKAVEDQTEIFMNSSYLKDCIIFLIDTGAGYVELRYTSPIRPVLFTIDKFFDYLITPIRNTNRTW